MALGAGRGRPRKKSVHRARGLEAVNLVVARAASLKYAQRARWAVKRSWHTQAGSLRYDVAPTAHKALQAAPWKPTIWTFEIRRASFQMLA